MIVLITNDTTDKFILQFIYLSAYAANTDSFHDHYLKRQKSLNSMNKNKILTYRSLHHIDTKISV